MSADLHWSSTLAVLGGIANGSYMVFVKRPEVLRVGVHPLVFQALKTAAAALYGVAILLIRLCLQEGGLHLNWLGAASACLWVPAGLCNIACVPLAGVGACAVASSCVASISSFGVGLYLGENVRPHMLLDSTFYVAPVYILGVCAGMVALIFAPAYASGLAGTASDGQPGARTAADAGPRCCPGAQPVQRQGMQPPTPNTESTELLRKDSKQDVTEQSEKSVYDGSPIATPRTPRLVGPKLPELELGGFAPYGFPPHGFAPDGFAPNSFDGFAPDGFAPSPATAYAPRWGSGAAGRRSVLVGYALACVAGVFASVMYMVVSIAKGRAHSHAARESLDPLGSWGVSFAIGAAVGTVIAAAAIASAYRVAGWPIPPLRMSVAFAPGMCAGAVWTVGNVFTTLAVARGGNAVAMAQNQATNLVTAGLWGLLLYREYRGRAAVAWAASALFTVTMVVLLSFEKAPL